jgi:hypothetical protein
MKRYEKKDEKRDISKRRELKYHVPKQPTSLLQTNQPLRKDYQYQVITLLRYSPRAAGDARAARMRTTRSMLSIYFSPFSLLLSFPLLPQTHVCLSLV